MTQLRLTWRLIPNSDFTVAETDIGRYLMERVRERKKVFFRLTRAGENNPCKTRYSKKDEAQEAAFQHYLATVSQLLPKDPAVDNAALDPCPEPDPANRQFLIFAGSETYPLGGWSDFKATASSLDAAVEAVANMRGIDWWQIVSNGRIEKKGIRQ